MATQSETRLARHNIVRDAVKGVLEFIHEDRFSMEDPEWNSDYNLYDTFIIIHYPYVRIRNEKGVEHDILDLYVRISIRGECLGPSFDGTRSTLTQLEAGGRYCHSHLDSEAINGFREFCKGSSSLSAVQVALQADEWIKDDKVDEDVLFRFEAWVHEIQVFIEWESLLGKPYMYIGGIAVGTVVNVDDTRKRISMFRFLRSLKPGDIKFRVENGIYQVIDNEDFRKKVFETCTDFQFIGPEGKKYSLPSIIPPGERESFRTFKFRGNYVKQKVVQSTRIHNYEAFEYVPHTQIVMYIKSSLNTYLKDATREYHEGRKKEDFQSRLTRVCEAYNTPPVLSEDYVPVSEASEPGVVGSPVHQEADWGAEEAGDIEF